MKKINIAIDGGAGTGKGTLSKPLANLLGYEVLDGGAMYRAASKFFLDSGIRPEDVSQYLGKIREISYDGKLPSVNGIQYSDEDIRTPQISKITPEYGKSPKFKDLIIKAQSILTSKSKGWVAEGRNMAFDVMLETGDVSIYLYTESLVVALRRWRERKAKDWEFPDILEEIKKRNEDDYRHNPPLMRPEDAKNQYDYFIDTTKGTIADNFGILVNIVRDKGIPIDSKKLESILKNINGN